jgi:osmotically-inducible protein OsmY
MLRLLASLILLGLVGAGFYYWKRHPGAAPRSLGEAQQQLQDVATTGAVKTALSLHRSLRPYAVSVGTENGIVTLRGEVPTAELLAATERVAAAVPDVRQVVNHVKVNQAVAALANPANDERSIGERLDDEALEVQLRLAFSLDRNLKGSRIEVESHKREVRLSGTLRSAAEKRLALQTASDVAGVKNVIDRLALVGQGDAEQRRAAVEKAIRSNANLRDAPISVRLDDETIVLLGSVKSGAERELAALLARDAAGQAVRNSLEIQRD